MRSRDAELDRTITRVVLCLSLASADAFITLEFAHRFGERSPELSNAVIRHNTEHE